MMRVPESYIAQQMRAEIERRGGAEDEPMSFREFIYRANPRYRFDWFHRVLCELLQRLVDGDIRHLMIYAPPQHGKSEIASRMLPAYFLHRYPRRWVGVCSYGATLARGFNRNARAYYQRNGGELNPAAQRQDEWETRDGGGSWSAGVGGSITGRPAHLGIIDDPLKNAEEAASAHIREKHKTWYDSTFYTRLQENERICVIQTRWHEDDLSGHLLAKEKESGHPENWTIAHFEALKTDESKSYPDTCTVVDDPRDVGAPLAPSRFTADRLRKTKANIVSYYWRALYQGRPSSESGVVWKRAWFTGNRFDAGEPPDDLIDVGYDWDTAYTENEKNSANAYVKSGRTPDGDIWILDADYRHCETPELEDWMVELGGPHYIEQKASGKSVAQHVSRRNVYVEEVAVMGDKYARTKLATPYGKDGKIHVARQIAGTLLDDDKQGILKWPNASHDDLNDALTQAVDRHMSNTISVTTLR